MQFPADLVTFTEEILNGKLHFFVQCGNPKLLMILRIVFVRMEVFLSTLLSKNALSQSKPSMALKIISAFACL